MAAECAEKNLRFKWIFHVAELFLYGEKVVNVA